MKSRLIFGDITGALSFHHERFEAKYESIYYFLGPKLPTLAQQIGDIELIYVEDNTAQYRITRDHDIDGTIVTITYYIYFSKDKTGLWKIEKY